MLIHGSGLPSCVMMQMLSKVKTVVAELQGKYSFASTYDDKPVKAMSSATKLEIKDKAKRVEQYLFKAFF